MKNSVENGSDGRSSRKNPKTHSSNDTFSQFDIIVESISRELVYLGFHYFLFCFARILVAKNRRSDTATNTTATFSKKKKYCTRSGQFNCNFRSPFSHDFVHCIDCHDYVIISLLRVIRHDDWMIDVLFISDLKSKTHTFPMGQIASMLFALRLHELALFVNRDNYSEPTIEH